MLKLLKGLKGGMMQQGQTLGQKAVRGAAWVTASSMADHVMSMLQMMLLARLLMPEDFGLMGLTMVVVHLAVVMTQCGISPAVVQRMELDERVLNTAWVIEMTRFLTIALIVFLLSWPTARFYGEPRLTAALQVLSLRFVMMAFRNIGVNLLLRDMNFKRHEIYQRTVALVGVLVTIGAAIWLRSFWALVIGQVTFGALELIGSYILHPYRPSFCFDRAAARSLLHFGKHIFMTGSLNFLKTNLDSILLGRLLGIEMLGYYRLARTLAFTPADLIAGPVASVTFPAYAQLQRQADAVRRGFVKVMRMSLALGLPAYAGMALLAPGLINLAYGANYTATVPIFRVFCILSVIGLLPRITAPLFNGIGKPRLQVVSMAMELAVFLPVIWPMTAAFGAVGAVTARIFSEGVMIAVALHFLNREVRLSWSDAWTAVCTPATATLIMLVALAPVVLLMGTATTWSLVILSLTGAAVYVLFHLLQRTEIVSDVQSVSTHIMEKGG